MSGDLAVLCLNGGSSSLKFAVYQLSGQGEQRLLNGAIEEIGGSAGKIWIQTGQESRSEKSSSFPDAAAAINAMFSTLEGQGIKNLAAAGHRIVHGGPDFTRPQRVDEKLTSALKKLVPFAPLHLPEQITMIEAVSKHYPDLPQVACFDTAFHCNMPEVAKHFALPQEFWEQGIRRYGFHGLSYEYVVGKLGGEIGSKAIIAHLGNGASMVALKDGSPMDTSMGLTPTGGFMMGTRSGDLDPGVILYLLNKDYSADRLEKLLNHQAGLAGVSGLSSDMKVLLEKRQSYPAADLAIRIFCYQIRKYIGAFAAVLGGLDSLVFTGGIGEHAAPVRAEICTGLKYLGIALDVAANRDNAEVISDRSARCVVRVVATDEDLIIVRHTRDAIFRVSKKVS
jgi:acetate kinase